MSGPATKRVPGGLHCEPVTAGDGAPAGWMYVLHGIYGAGRNWGTIARRVVRARPDWGALLVDLREHGDSRGFPPPHTIAAAAADLDTLAARFPPAAVLGHSFGGKVALAWARSGRAGLRQVWSIDSTPDAGPPRGSAWQMLEIVERLPGPFDAREDAVNALVEAGTAEPVARWMTTNLRPADGVFHWRLDFEAIRALLEDFFRTDVWPVVEALPAGLDLHVVRATESSVITAEAVERFLAAGPRVHLHLVEGGHWLNADNPEALLERLTEHLPGPDADPAEPT